MIEGCGIDHIDEHFAVAPKIFRGAMGVLHSPATHGFHVVVVKLRRDGRISPLAMG
jgi:hypothetical protein